MIICMCEESSRVRSDAQWNYHHIPLKNNAVQRRPFQHLTLCCHIHAGLFETLLIFLPNQGICCYTVKKLNHWTKFNDFFLEACSKYRLPGVVPDLKQEVLQSWNSCSLPPRNPGNSSTVTERHCKPGWWEWKFSTSLQRFSFQLSDCEASFRDR